MFIRPDWQDKASYEWLLSETTSLQQLAWEFLRRSPQYLECIHIFWSSYIDAGPFNCLELDDRLIDSGREYDPEILARWTQDWATWWRMRRPATPAENEGCWDFYSPIDDEPESFVRMEGRLTGSRVLMPVDLSLPLEVTIARLQEEVRELRERGSLAGLVKPQITRVLSRQKYCEYLRILDAIEVGETYFEIWQTLSPGATQDPTDKQLDKRTRAAHASAMEMSAGGYKGLLDRDPVFSKK